MNFKLISEFEPTGDQPRAIDQLLKGIEDGIPSQTLLGVTGSGKTFTMANVVEKLQRPTLVLSHNKTLAAQLYGEFKRFFPENSVEYFISYYDYYQPEAYLPTTNVYIEKDLSINEEIEKMRLSTTSSLLSGRRDVIVVASVSCIYGIGNPEEFGKNVITIQQGDKISRNKFLLDLVDILYSRSDADFKRGTFRVRGDTIDLFVAYADFIYRFVFWGDEIETIQRIDPTTGYKQADEKLVAIFPANLFVTSKDVQQIAIKEIQDDMVEQVQFFEDERKMSESERIKERTELDLEMIREIGYCSGIENYSRYFDRRKPGDRPFCLLDYFPDDYLMMIDESHVTIPQVRAMWGGDRSRKINLVEYGFRLPSALDNRPLTFNEFESQLGQVIFVSATPADYELRKSEGVVVEQLIRPTGLLDPKIDVRSSINQIDDLMEEIQQRINLKDRILITTITKRMAEKLTDYLLNLDVKTKYIHSEVDTLDRVEIIRELRLGKIDVIVGVNLLREGLDIPEVSLVVILDADKEGFLRNERSLVQTIGRAARNERGQVIMYADRITKSMKVAIEETNRRRSVQMDYNAQHGIIPKSVRKDKEVIFEQTNRTDNNKETYDDLMQKEKMFEVAESSGTYLSKEQLKKLSKETKKRMEKAAKELSFLEAAKLRDEWMALEEKIKKY